MIPSSETCETNHMPNLAPAKNKFTLSIHFKYKACISLPMCRVRPAVPCHILLFCSFIWLSCDKKLVIDNLFHLFHCPPWEGLLEQLPHYVSWDFFNHSPR